MPKRNWNAIAQLKDLRTRIAISLVKDPEILACYAAGFPHLFLKDEEDAGPLCIPLSVLMEAAWEYSKKEYADRPGFWEIDRHVTLGFAAEYNQELALPGEVFGQDHADSIPQEVLGQLVGQKIQAGMTVTYKGRKQVVLSLDGDFEVGSIIGVDFPKIDNLTLVDADFVNLDA